MDTYRPVIQRHYYGLRIELLSPLSISGGKAEITDADVLTNGNGEVFIPGTSLAGAMRNFLEHNKKTESILGFADGNQAKMSSVYISDLYFDKEPVVSVRDRVALTAEKTVANKFDMEIIESGAKGVLYLNYVVRQGENQKTFEEELHSIFQAIQRGEIRIGANKNRGFGRLHIESISQKKFIRQKGAYIDTLGQWRAFKKHWKDLDKYNSETYEQWAVRQQEREPGYVKITVPLKLTGGISIRTYSADPEKTDFSHITCNKQPVIPGNSWAGAIRADVRSILFSVMKDKMAAEAIIEKWFGMVRQEGKEARQSILVVGESIIKGGAMVPVMRNQISRFDSSAKDGALYSEISCFGGTTDLELLIKKDKEKEYCALVGMMSLVIQDIQSGYVPVGGQAAVGRGIFQADDSKAFEYSELIDMDDCMEKLCRLLEKEGGVV